MLSVCSSSLDFCTDESWFKTFLVVGVTCIYPRLCSSVYLSLWPLGETIIIIPATHTCTWLTLSWA